MEPCGYCINFICFIFKVRIAAELTTTAMSVFPFHTVVNTLSPLVQTSSYPRIDGAMKMITRLIDQHPNELTDDHLTSLMPGLIKVCVPLLLSR